MLSRSARSAERRGPNQQPLDVACDHRLRRHPHRLQTRTCRRACNNRQAPAFLPRMRRVHRRARKAHRASHACLPCPRAQENRVQTPSQRQRAAKTAPSHRAAQITHASRKSAPSRRYRRPRPLADATTVKTGVVSPTARCPPRRRRSAPPASALPACAHPTRCRSAIPSTPRASARRWRNALGGSRSRRASGCR